MIIGIICDALVLFLIVFSIIRGYRSGLIKTAFRLRKIYAFIIAYKFYQPLSDKICGTYVMPVVSEKIDAAVQNAMGDAGITSESLTESIPSWVERLAKICNIDIEQMAESAVEGGNNVIATFVTNITGYVANLISVILSAIALYFVSLIALRLIEFILSAVFKIKLLKIVDKIGGTVFGILTAVIFAFIGAYIIRYGMEALVSSGKFDFLSSYDISKTYVVRTITKVNPLSWFTR